ncbi:hypothetical protein C0992_000018 [Termitomyces sp. T32_za158]|nr:hypothetical protein C0992_000018 [Termitomyces sp. T32_za158]
MGRGVWCFETRRSIAHLPQPEWFRLLQGFFTAAICVMGSRLVLSLRRAYYRYSPGDMNLDNDQATRYWEGDGTVMVMPLIEISDSHQNSQESELSSLHTQQPASHRLDSIYESQSVQHAF